MTFHIMIIPTLSCPSNCSYCWGSEKKAEIMDIDVIRQRLINGWLISEMTIFISHSMEENLCLQAMTSIRRHCQFLQTVRHMQLKDFHCRAICGFWMKNMLISSHSILCQSAQVLMVQRKSMTIKEGRDTLTRP